MSTATVRASADRLPHFQTSGRLRWRRIDGRLELRHRYSPAEISDTVVVDELTALVGLGAISGQSEFEAAAVDLITSTDADPRAAWRGFYANSVAQLQSGTADFSPIHQRGRALLEGDSVLEVGCCFGFFALQCSMEGYAVTAVDICAGALDLLDDAATHLRAPVKTALADVRRLPFNDNQFDTVTVLHLLEHLDSADVATAIAESCRVARRRVIIAVPYESTASPHFGHLETVSEADLRRWAGLVPGARTQIFTDHGGWLVIDLD